MSSAALRTSLALAIPAMLVLALLPRPALPLVTALHGPVTMLLAPVQQPARAVVVWLRGEERKPGAGDPTDIANLEFQLDQARLELRQARQEVEDLRAMIKNLSRGMELNPSLSVRQITAPVIGFGADLSGGIVTVRAGKAERVSVNDVVAVRGVYLMGRVVRVEERTCGVKPITQKGFGKFDGVIMLDDQHLGPECQLEAAGDGTLIGKVKYTGEIGTTAELPQITSGMTVRLSDKEWPPSAKMLVVGTITRVEPSPSQSQRLLVTVEPLQNLAHTSEVIVRIPESATASAEEGKGKP